MHGDIRDDWKISAIESKVRRVENRMHELGTLHSNVDRLEREHRETRSEIAGLRFTIQTLQEKIDVVQENE